MSLPFTLRLIVVVVLISLSACTGAVATPVPLLLPVDSTSTVPPAWARDPVGQWLNMDWDLWSCPQAHKCCPWRAGGECQ